MPDENDEAALLPSDSEWLSSLAAIAKYEISCYIIFELCFFNIVVL